MMKESTKQLLKRVSEDEILKQSVNYIINDEFQNPKILLKRLIREVDNLNIIELSFFYVDDFVRETKDFCITMHTVFEQTYFHKHNFIELIYVFEGECRQYINNIDKILVLKKDQVMIISPGSAHAILSCTREDYIIKMFIPRDYLYSITDGGVDKDNRNIFASEKFDSRVKQQIFTVNKDSKCKIDFFMEGIIEDYYGSGKFRNSTIKCYLNLLIAELFRGEEYKTIEEVVDQKIMHYIELEYKSISLKQLSKHFGYSEKYMSRLIKELFGIGFIKLLNSIRLKKGLFYLLNTEMTIEEIAHELGFKNSSNFYRLMNNELGLTPNRVRLKDKRKRERK